MIMVMVIRTLTVTMMTIKQRSYRVPNVSIIIAHGLRMTDIWLDTTRKHHRLQSTGMYMSVFSDNCLGKQYTARLQFKVAAAWTNSQIALTICSNTHGTHISSSDSKRAWK